MKRNSLILIALAAAIFTVVGCKKQEGVPPTSSNNAPAASVDTSKLTAAFESAEPAAKKAVDTAVTAIKNADYSSAVTQLQDLAKKYTLTDAQQTAIKDTIASVQKVMADLAGKAATDAGNAAKALPQ